MRLLLVVVAWMAALPLFAENLSEAVQHSLIINPEVLLGSTNGLQTNSSHMSTIYKQKSFATSNIFNALKLDSYNVKNLKTQRLADDLALEVSKYYLKVLLQEKLVNYAQNNLRINRSIYLSMKDKRKVGNVSQRDFDAISKRLALAELQQIHAEANLKATKTRYAKLVGSWPHNLQWPRLPTSKELPATVNDAIEQGLDNLAITLSIKDKQQNRSMSALSEKVRDSWNDWTKAGLDVISLRKQVASLNQSLNLTQEKFKKGRTSWLVYLDGQNKLYKEQIQYANAENNEAFARLQILNAVGKLVNFINLAEIEEDNAVLSEAMLSASAIDKIVLPYPNYKPHFLGMVDTKSASTTTSWYVSAGKFKNNANALALINKLKALGFIVSSETLGNETVVLVGPYEYPGHAAKGIERLKEIAHVQGALVNYKQKPTLTKHS